MTFTGLLSRVPSAVRASRSLIAAACCGLAIASTVAAQPTPARRLEAVRTSTPIVVDGRLDEADWSRAPVATGFTQQEPDEGQAATEVTEVRVLYDDAALYVGVFAAHRDVHDIIVNELTRDFDGSSTDWVSVIVDPFLDRRNGYQFGVNPGGAAWDSQKFNEGRERNLSWDGVWTVRTTLAHDGWYAEYAIPFRTLQVPNADPQAWGINFQRHLQRRLENSFWAPVPRPYALDRLSLAGTLEGLRGVEPGANIRVKPYVRARGGERSETRSGSLDVGLDAKYSITSSLTADLTVHTDFSQVEADLHQVGATRFGVRFPEKREFFLENTGAFQFGPGNARADLISSSQGTSAGGRDNSVQEDVSLFFSRRIGLSASGDRIPIAVGARLTGRVAGTAVGVLHMQQQAGGGEAASQFTVASARRNVLAASDIGVMVLDRQWKGADANRVAGVDVNLRPTDALLVYGYGATTLASQADARRPARGRESTARAGATWNNGRWIADASYGLVGARFVDEIGFVPRTGIERRQAMVGRQVRPARASRWLREIYPAVGVTDIRREGGGFDSRYTEYRLGVTFAEGTTLEFGANPNVEDLPSRFFVSRERGIVVEPGRYEFTDAFVSLATSRSRPVTADARVSTGDYYGGRRDVVQVAASARLNAHVSGRVALTRDDVRLPSGSMVTNLAEMRVDCGFSTRLFLNALVQYDSSNRQWDTNVRFNFIHRPLSDVFVVLSDRRADRPDDVRDRSVTLKVTRLLAF